MSRPLFKRTKGLPEASAPKVGRNAPCPCGSGKKHKKCCGTARPLPAAASRECGACRACCTVLGEPSIGVKSYETCPYENVHQDMPGCSLHERMPKMRQLGFTRVPRQRRPPECRDYACVWLLGDLEDDERPDRVGVVVDSDEGLEGVWGFAANVREVSPGAAELGGGLRIVHRLVKGGAAVFVIGEGGRRTFVCTDPEKRAKFARIKAERS